MSQAASRTGIQGVNVAMVPVHDVDEAIAFYTQKLGFELRADVGFGEGDRWVEVAPAGDSGTTVALVPPRGEVQPGQHSRISFDTADVDALHAELKANGVDVDAEVSKFGGPVPPMFWFRDQDGTTHLVVQVS